MAVEGIDPARVPRHIAAVMDGNGRWAERRGLRRTEGHAAGEEALLDATNGCLELGVDWFTVYAFSTENWKRPADEVRRTDEHTSELQSPMRNTLAASCLKKKQTHDTNHNTHL